MTQRVCAARNARRGRRTRAVCKKRGVDPTRARARVWTTVFCWRVDDVRHESTSLLHAVKKAGGARITVHGGSTVQSNVRTVRRAYGSTVARVRFADGRERRLTLRHLGAGMLMAQAPAGQRVVRLRVRDVVQTPRWREGAHDALLQTIASTRAGGRALLRFMGYRDLEIMWARATRLTAVHERERARGRLAARARAGWGCQFTGTADRACADECGVPAGTDSACGATAVPGVGQ